MASAVVQAFYTVYHTHDLERLHSLLAESYVGQVNGSEIIGAPAAQVFIQAFLTAFPDVRYTLHDSLVAGPKEVTRWSATATHRSEFAGIAATQKSVIMTGITIFQVEAGRIQALWNSWDVWGLLQQLRA